MSGWRWLIERLRAQMPAMSEAEQRAPGRPYLVMLVDPAGVVWRVTRSPALKSALSDLGVVPDGWAVVVDRTAISGRGREVTIADYARAVRDGGQ